MAVAVPESKASLERLGPFKITRTLAQGGMSEVYLAMREGDFDGPDQVVLKVLRVPEMHSHEVSRVKDLLARLIEEGRLGLRLIHPSIARSYGVLNDPAQDVYFLVQEFVEGATLGSLMDYYVENDLRLPYNIILRLIIPVLEALHYGYHDALREDGRPLRVVHRDIKPDNIMLAFEGTVRLVDFGVARSTSLTRPVTVGDLVVGTRHYMAPEQVFAPEQVGHRTDIFSVGLILFELCTLRPVFPRTRAISEFAEALSNFRFADYEQLIDARRYPGVREVLARVLVADPRERYPSAGAMALDLKALALSAPTEPSLQVFAQQFQEDIAEAESAHTVIGPSEDEATGEQKPLRPVASLRDGGGAAAPRAMNPPMSAPRQTAPPAEPRVQPWDAPARTTSPARTAPPAGPVVQPWVASGSGQGGAGSRPAASVGAVRPPSPSPGPARGPGEASPTRPQTPPPAPPGVFPPPGVGAVPGGAGATARAPGGSRPPPSPPLPPGRALPSSAVVSGRPPVPTAMPISLLEHPDATLPEPGLVGGRPAGKLATGVPGLKPAPSMPGPAPTTRPAWVLPVVAVLAVVLVGLAVLVWR